MAFPAHWLSWNVLHPANGHFPLGVAGAGAGFLEGAGEGFLEGAGEGFLDGAGEGFLDGAGEGFLDGAGEGESLWKHHG